MFSCDKCTSKFIRNDTLKRHLKTHESGSIAKKQRQQFVNSDPLPSTSGSVSKCNTLCKVYNITLSSKRSLFGHFKSEKHKNNSLRSYLEDENILIIDSAFKSRIISYRVKDKSTYILLEPFLDAIRGKVVKLIQLQSDVHTALKVNLELYAYYCKNDVDGNKLCEVKS